MHLCVYICIVLCICISIVDSLRSRFPAVTLVTIIWVIGIVLLYLEECHNISFNIFFFFKYTLYGWLKYMWVSINYVVLIPKVMGSTWIPINHRKCIKKSVLLVRLLMYFVKEKIQMEREINEWPRKSKSLSLYVYIEPYRLWIDR